MNRVKVIVIFVSVFLMFFNFVLPPIIGLSSLGMSVVCIFVGTLLLLTCIDLMWPVLLCILAFAVNDVYSVTNALQKSFGNHIFWFVAFASILVHVLREAGVLWRISTALFRLKIVKTHPWLFLGCVFYAILLLGCVLEPATLTIIFIGLFSSVFEQLHIEKGNRFAESVIMGVLVFAGMSYGITPLGHPVAMVAVSTFEPLFSVGMGEYTLVGLIFGASAVVVYMLMMKFVFRIDISPLQKFDVSVLQISGPWTKEEKIVSAIYVSVILLWLAPSLLSGVDSWVTTFMNELGIIGPVMAGTCAMCLIHIKGKPIADLTSLLRDAVPWRCCLPVAASMLLGSALTSEEVGMANALSSVLGPFLRELPMPVFMLVLAVFCSLFTDFTSNAITAMITSAICVVFIQTGFLPDLHPGAMAIILGICSNLSFMYPAGSTYAAIISGCGWVRMKTQIKEGFIYSLIMATLACTVGYGFACIVM